MEQGKADTAKRKLKEEQKKIASVLEDFHHWYGPFHAGEEAPKMPLELMHILFLKEQVKKLETQNKTLKWLIHFLNKNPQSISSLQQESAEVNETLPAPEDKPAALFPAVTKRELEILKLLADGYCAKEIAGKLFISETTVITHKKNLKEKFKVKNTPQLVSKANAMLHAK